MSQLDYLILKRKLAESGYELVMRGETVYIRRRPWTRDRPTEKMLAARGAMKLASKSQIGKRGLTERGLPVVAEGNRVQIPAAMHFIKVMKPAERASIARRVATECGLAEDEKEMLIQLVS